MSNYLNFSVRSEDDIKDWTMKKLGYPLVQVEITDDQLQICIDDAVEEFTKYVLQEVTYVGLDLEDYATSGFTLDGNVTSVFALEESTIYGDITGGINVLFSVKNTMWNAGMFPLPGSGGAAGSWVDFEAAMSYVDMIQRMTAAKFYFEFNERTQHLELIPNPTLTKMKGNICLGVNTIRPDDQQYGESWVKRFTLAGAKEIIGYVRSKYNSTQLLGGGLINASIKEEGLAEKQALLDELKSTYTFTKFFMG